MAFYCLCPWIWAGWWLFWPIDENGSENLWLPSLSHKRPWGFCLFLWNSYSWRRNLRPPCWGHHAGDVTCKHSGPLSQLSPAFQTFQLRHQTHEWSCLGPSRPVPLPAAHHPATSINVTWKRRITCQAPPEFLALKIMQHNKMVIALSHYGDWSAK